MRKITIATSAALLAGTPLGMGNTTITHDNGYSTMLLHGHGIATYDHMNEVLTLDDCGYQTATTKERLNGVLRAFHLPLIIKQSDFKWSLYGRSEGRLIANWSGRETFELKASK